LHCFPVDSRPKRKWCHRVRKVANHGSGAATLGASLREKLSLERGTRCAGGAYSLGTTPRRGCHFQLITTDLRKRTNPCHRKPLDVHLLSAPRRCQLWPCPAIASTLTAEPDPIFPVIEAHKRAYMHQMQVCQINFNIGFHAPESPTPGAAENAARTATDKVEHDLCNISPTTLAGVTALLAYADDFCCQKFAQLHGQPDRVLNVTGRHV
jgi:hypothetical protein